MAREVDAYLLSDEVYRHLDHNAVWSPSVADLYEKGLSTGSMSKVFSLAGLRMGWIAARDASARRAFLNHRDYNLISCGVLDDVVSAVALKGSKAILSRNRTLIAKNLAILDAWIQDEPKLDYVKPTAGTTALVHYRGEMDSVTFSDRLFKETGVLVVPGDAFEEPKSFRIGYACSSDTLRKGLQALSEFLERNE